MNYCHAVSLLQSIYPGQGQERGIRCVWICQKIDGKPYSLELLDDKIDGPKSYQVSFSVGDAGENLYDDEDEGEPWSENEGMVLMILTAT